MQKSHLKSILFVSTNKSDVFQKFQEKIALFFIRIKRIHYDNYCSYYFIFLINNCLNELIKFWGMPLLFWIIIFVEKIHYHI